MYISRLHEEGHDAEALAAAFAETPIDSGFIPVLQQLKALGADARILSDANTFSISTILQKHKLESVFTEVVTNFARFEESGRYTKPDTEQLRCI